MGKTEEQKGAIESLSFEEGMKQLEDLVQKVEAGNLPLEKVVASYESGVTLVKHLRSLLQGAEEKIRVLHKDMSETEVDSL